MPTVRPTIAQSWQHGVDVPSRMRKEIAEARHELFKRGGLSEAEARVLYSRIKGAIHRRHSASGAPSTEDNPLAEHEAEMERLKGLLFAIPLYPDMFVPEPMRTILADTTPAMIWAVMVLDAVAANDIYAANIAYIEMMRALREESRPYIARGLKEKSDARTSGRKKRGHQGSMRKAIHRICQEIQEPDLTKVLDALGENWVERLYTDGEIDVLFHDVYQNEQVVSYNLRRDPSNSTERKITFKTINNNLSDLRAALRSTAPS